MPALARHPAQAAGAGSARHRPRQHHAIARGDVGDTSAHVMHHAGPLVAEQHGEGRTPVPMTDGPVVAVANPACLKPNADLARAGRLDQDRFDPDGSAGSLDDCAAALDGGLGHAGRIRRDSRAPPLKSRRAGPKTGPSFASPDLTYWTVTSIRMPNA